MYSQELKVLPKSDYYVYAPSAIATKLYLYPTITGYFYYEPGYHIKRNRFDSFLIMYIAAGSCEVTVPNHCFTAKAGQFVLIDCYQPHGYGSEESWEALWLHFDGTLAKDYYEEIYSIHGNLFTPEDSQTMIYYLQKIYNIFKTSSAIFEGKLSAYITDLLNIFLISSVEKKKKTFYTDTIAVAKSYINEHFQSELTLDILAEKTNMSPFHFTRVFSKETGFTPHQYLIKTRLSAAKFLLNSSEMSIKDIAFSTGFNSESNFCTTFKKWESITPSQYRQDVLD